MGYSSIIFCFSRIFLLTTQIDTGLLSIFSCMQVGFLVIVQANERIAVENDPRFRFLFAEGDALYYKTPRMDVLDDSIGDLSAAIQDLEGLLLRQLAEEILKEEIALTEAVRACAELDILMAFDISPILAGF